MKPPTFDGINDPLVAESWVKSMEKMFRVLPCMDEQKVAFATFTFLGEAYEWWLLTLEKKPNMTWQRFLEVFNEKYFPNSLREQKAAEFLTLEQGNMTMAEYEAKFTSLG